MECILKFDTLGKRVIIINFLPHAVQQIWLENLISDSVDVSTTIKTCAF